MEIKKTILVSAKNADIKDRLVHYFDNSGYRVLIVDNFAGLMETLESYNIDLIVAGLQMPGISIVDFIPYLRRKFRDLKVIVLMENYSSDVEIFLRGYNVSCTLQWPVQRRLFLSIVNRAVSREREMISS